MSRDAVIVSTARTPLTKAARGAFNNTTGATLGAWSIKTAVERAGLEGGEIDDVLMGTAVQQGSTGGNVARLAALRAGLPVTVPAMTIDRQCSSGLMTIATAAKQVLVDNMDICVAGGVESISKVVGSGKMFVEPDRALLEMGPTQLNIPRDFFYGDVECEIPRPINIERGAGGEQSLDEAAALLASAKFPVILAGGGIVKSASELGIVTVAGGSIEASAGLSFEVNQSRVFTLDRGDVLLWLRGAYRSYTDYSLEAVGLLPGR